MKEKFEYMYSAPTPEERNEIINIRDQYLPKTNRDQKLEELRKLDKKIKNVPTIFGLCFGVIGLLFFGAGMSFFLELTLYWYFGIPCSIIGIVLISIAYPIYKVVNRKYVEKYGKMIVKISDELLNNQDLK